MSALLGCVNCGFVTRKNSHIGRSGRCPRCGSPLGDVSLLMARAAMQQRRLGRDATRLPRGSRSG